MAITETRAVTETTGKRFPQGAPRFRGKLLFLTRSLERGGAERQLVTLARALHTGGVNVIVVTFYAGGPLRRDLEDAGVKVLDLGKRGRWDNLTFLMRLLRLLRAESPLVLHSYLGVANILTALASFVLPGTRIVWGVRASDMDLSRYDWLSRVVWWLERRLSRVPDLIIANSRAGRSHAIASGFPEDRIRVILNGIDIRRFHYDPVGRQRMRATWGIQENELLIGLAARLDPMKGHATFLKAAALLSAAPQPLRFVCIGDGSVAFRRELESLASRAGMSRAMLWAGAVDEMPAAYSALDIAVSASCFGEGFSNAIAEAMACQRPCVITDVGDSAWIVGEAGVVVPATDAPAMAMALTRMAEMDAGQRLALGTAARARVENEFTEEHLLSNTLSALEQVACV